MKISYLALAAGLVGIGGNAFAEPNAMPGSVNQVLLEQANYWRAQNQLDKTADALSRLLLIDPSNTDALAMQAEVLAAKGDRTGAQKSLAALKALKPAAARMTEVEQTVRAGALDPGALNDARQLAQAGKGTEAVNAYKRLFQGSTPPRALAPEFYETVAGTERWDEARQGLETLVNADPQNLQMQLGYARTLTYREPTRQQGITRLAALTKHSEIATAADTAWRNALLWLGATPANAPMLRDYLASHPGDSGIEARLAEAMNPAKTPADIASARRADGFTALNASNVAEAEKSFQAALEQKADDADALGGLGLVRLRQHKADEAKRLLSQAMAADPAHKSRWEKALAGASAGEDYAQARTLAAHGDLAAADHQLRMIIAHGGDVTGAQEMLANVAQRRGDLPAAESAYRAVLSARPGDATATAGLIEVLRRRGQDDEANTLLDRLQAAGKAGVVGRIRADALRQQAAQTQSSAEKIPLLRAAATAAPNDPWISLDLARALSAAGRSAEARAIMAGVAGGNAGVDALRAAALFATEDNQPELAADLVARLPAAARTSDMKVLLGQAHLQNDIRAALSTVAISPSAGRGQLLALAAHPDPDGSRGVAIAKAFLQIQNPPAAREALATALAATPASTAAQRIAYSGVMLQAGDERGAQMMVASITDRRGLSPQQVDAMNQIRAGVAVRQADALNTQGRQADAYDVLSPALARDPENPVLQMALARLYMGAENPRKAVALNQALLARDPGNLDVRRTALDAAIQMHDWAQARQLVQDAIVIAPDDPRTWLMAGHLHHALGEGRTALADLKRARDLRQQQLGADQLTQAPKLPTRTTLAMTVIRPDSPFGSDADFAPAGNPFRQSAASALDEVSGSPAGLTPNDPVSAEIAREMTGIHQELAPNLTLGAVLRSRTGTAGLDRLNEVTAPMTLLSHPLGVGTVTVRATPTFLSSGEVPLDAKSQASFGTGAFGPRQAPPSQYATGIGLSGQYQTDWLGLDVGTSPIGFQEQNLLGGIEFSPEVGDGVRLRVAGERRAVTDSVLSYAGTKDPATGQAWGGVTRLRGHGQIELTKGAFSTYAGGGYAVLDGTNVAQNREYEMGAGASYQVWHQGNDALRLGLDLVYFGYDKNLRFFTVGQGGYFSPQSYFAALIPLRYTSKGETFDWSLGGSVGYQTYHEKSSPVFPNNPGMQNALIAEAGADPNVSAFYAGKSAAGLVGGAEGSVEYHLDGNTRLGASATYQHAGDWSEFRALLTAKYSFMGSIW
jgi:cellulose synthase operon protein C